MEIFPYLTSSQISTGFCVTHKLATFPTSQYSQSFKRKVEVTMKFETNLTQDPVSTRKKETFVQSYILLYSIFFEKIGNYCCRVAKFVVSTQNCYHFIQNFHLPYKLPKAHGKFLWAKLHISDANYTKLCNWNHRKLSCFLQEF